MMNLSYDGKSNFPTGFDKPVECVQFEACNGSIRCIPVKVLKMGNPPVDAWWCIESQGMPNRVVRLSNGITSLKHFLFNYGYMDSSGCVSTRKVTVYLTNAYDNSRSECVIPFEKKGDVLGVPQRSVHSGICWFSATLFVMLFSKQMRQLFMSHFDAEMARFAKDALSNPSNAEKMRHKLYYQHAFGDNPRQNPELDGQNGFAQLCILLAKFQIPTVRLFAPSMSEITHPVTDQKGSQLHLKQEYTDADDALLCVRCFRTHWRPKRRIVYQGRKFYLVAVLIGSEHCGHQIGASTVDMRICRWAVTDSDAAQYGIGPLFWRMPKLKDESKKSFKARWWNLWSNIIPVTVFMGNSLCDLSPHNRSTGSLRTNHPTRNSHTESMPGVVNSDFIYMSHAS